MSSAYSVATPSTSVPAARYELPALMSTSPYLSLPQRHQFELFTPKNSAYGSTTGKTSGDPGLPFPVSDLSSQGPSSIHGEEHPIGATSGPDGKARLRKACDSCSIRKVKCDEEGPPCRPCAALDIPCTFQRPSRRRGPPNRHAEAIKKRRVESPATPGQSTPSSPTHAAHAAQTLASFAQHHVLSAESICPFPVLQLLVDDYFLFIHPLIPVPHEPSFRDGLQRREDVNNPRFLALLASMIGCLVASFPRKPRLHLKAQNKENLFPNSISLIERCRKVAVEARGPGYLDRDLDVYDTATSYLLAVSSAYTFNWPRCRLYMGECLTMLTVIGLSKSSNHSFSKSMSPGSGDESVSSYNMDIIRQEMVKRIFWVIFVSIRAIHQLGASFRELWIYPDSPSKPYPDLPIEVDDAYIFPTHVLPQPKGILSEIVGFNANVRVYNTYNDLYRMDITYGPDELYNWDHQRRIFDRCLQAAKQVLGDVPTELMLSPGVGSNQFEQSRDLLGSTGPNYPETSDPGPYPSIKTEDTAANRRALQFEIQKANINGSQLATRCYIVEKYWNLYDKHRCIRSGNNTTNNSNNSINEPAGDSPDIAGAGYPTASTSHMDLTEREMASERENIVKDLLTVLGNISQVSMEPNGGSFIYKIRQIASTLLDVPRTRKGQLALRAEEYLAAFVDVLMKLEHVSSHTRGREGDVGTDEDEEAELRIWADLREYQDRFARSGGFLAED